MSHKTFRKEKTLFAQIMWPTFYIHKLQKELYLSVPTRLRIVVRPKNKPCYLIGLEIMGFGFALVYEPKYTAPTGLRI